MSPKRFETPNLLLVEGDDDQRFLEALASHMKLADFTTVVCGGKSGFARALPGIVRTPGFGKVARCAVFRDSDTDPHAAFESVKQALHSNQLPVPSRPASFTDKLPRTGIFLFPGDNATGMLEDLCLHSVSSHPLIHCIDLFFNCIDSAVSAHESLQPPSNVSKARAHAFLAAMHRTVPHVGIGAQRGYWDFDHPAMNSLRTFLETLCK